MITVLICYVYIYVILNHSELNMNLCFPKILLYYDNIIFFFKQTCYEKKIYIKNKINIKRLLVYFIESSK